MKEVEAYMQLMTHFSSNMPTIELESSVSSLYEYRSGY